MLFSRDTSPEARALLIEILRRKSPAEKLMMVDDACTLARELTMTGLRMRNPDAGPSELRILYLEHVLGPKLARKALAAMQGRKARPPAPEPDGRHGG